MEVKTMPCDWCHKDTECCQVEGTHYWICMECAVSRFFEAQPAGKK